MNHKEHTIYVDYTLRAFKPICGTIIQNDTYTYTLDTQPLTHIYIYIYTHTHTHTHTHTLKHADKQV